MAKSDKKKDSTLPQIGDLVRIKVGGVDIPTGTVMKKGWKYSEDGGTLWGKVGRIDTKSDGSKRVIVYDEAMTTIIWQVKPEDISPKTIKAEKTQSQADDNKKDAKNNKEEIEEVFEVPPVEDEYTGYDFNSSQNSTQTVKTGTSLNYVNGSVYALTGQSKKPVWTKGRPTKQYGAIKNGRVKPSQIRANATATKLKKDASSNYNTKKSVLNEDESSYEKVTIDFDNNKDIPSSIKGTSYKTTGESDTGTIFELKKKLKRNVVVNQYKPKTAPKRNNTLRDIIIDNSAASEVQNGYGFPYKTDEKDAGSTLYDYQFIPGDTRYKNSPTADIESRMESVRASLGLPVHGNPDLARSMKFYLYNRFKVPDYNMLYNKAFTHVFFTRPDINLLELQPDGNVTANGQIMNHTDTSFMWRSNPELFKLLTDCSHCGDSNNFNMLLSNQVMSFNLQNEGISTIKSQKSWNEHEMSYGANYNGKTGGTFSCTFEETSEMSIINLMKLWITYISNVSNGAWSPHYPTEQELIDNTGYSHVFDRALDYAASVYVFKCAPNGEDVLYWSKYYGVFPTVNGAEALAWEKGAQEAPRISITFEYCYKTDWNPISLIEFNDTARIKNNKDVQKYIPPYESQLAATGRPFVGCPFIEITMADPKLNKDDVAYGARTHIKLKYKQDPLRTGTRSDNNLYNVYPGGKTELSNDED